MKQLFGVDTTGTYTFSKTAQTVTFAGVTLTLQNILVINNASANQIIYNFADSSAGAASFSSNTLTLDYDTSSMSDSDELQIWIDLPQQTTVKTKEVSGADSLLLRILQALVSPRAYDAAQNRLRGTVAIESGTVTTVSTVSSLSNISSIGGYSAQQLTNNVNASAWADCVRSRIG